LNETELALALGVQWGCPFFPLERNQSYLQCADLLPLMLLESSRALPVHFHGGSLKLYLAFTERIDHTLLYAVEQMLHCHAAPCVASENAVVEAFRRIRLIARPNETVFDSLRNVREMAMTACSYAAKLQASSLEIARVAGYIWVRLFGSRAAHDLLFDFRLIGQFSPTDGELSPFPDSPGSQGHR